MPELSAEVEAALENIFSDATHGTDNPLYDGRAKEDIEDDIALVRSELDIEL